MTTRSEARLCPCKACRAPFEPWSPSMASEAIRREIARAHDRKWGASWEIVTKLREAANTRLFDDEPNYVHWFFESGLGSAPTPWRGEGAFVG